MPDAVARMAIDDQLYVWHGPEVELHRTINDLRRAGVLNEVRPEPGDCEPNNTSVMLTADGEMPRWWSHGGRADTVVEALSHVETRVIALA